MDNVTHLPLNNQSYEFTIFELEILKTVLITMIPNHPGYSVAGLRVLKSTRDKVISGIMPRPSEPEKPQVINPGALTPEETKLIAAHNEAWFKALKDYYANKVTVTFNLSEVEYLQTRMKNFDKFQSSDQVVDAVVSLADKLSV